MMATITNSNVRLLAALVDSNDEEESEYRLLVDEEHVKYVTVDPGVFPKDDRTFAPVLIPMLPPFPPGNWNEGHISKDPLTQQPVFSRVTHSDLPGIRNTWYDRRVDHLELKKLNRVRQNIHHVTCPAFDFPVLVKFAEFPWQMPFFEAETTAYEWIEGKGIGPRFLGHLTEAGRVFGFVMENIDGARTAEPRDLAACQRILAKLHALGIKHGDINKHNFLIKNGEAVLIDFETAQKCSEKAELESEYKHLELLLKDPSRRGGVGIPVVSDHRVDKH
ncbi:hypothetical protein E0Z10_g7808 [Xylaria hypoxylon]|uniref:Aminoglycoside phosphotransferase domain-containing protein n=1 Tax=Xylaria hypoxylon TaxID=37992 RepID=A0A4Z0YU02_9PEZI|nr:hypothetical protein E0Z10_g7808 [Xylaria hypoxylon]